MNKTTSIFYLAPLRGVTDYIFRNLFELHFGAFDFLLTPFIPTVKGQFVNPSHLRDIRVEHNDCSRVIPQIIGNQPSEFIVLARTLFDMGYPVVNWNLGCPSPQIARKKRGCGLLPHYDYLQWFLDEIFTALPCPLSLKVRLGYEQDSELRKLIPLFNQYPLHEIIIHARTGRQMYDGVVNLDSFESCLMISKHPIVYNGDITTVAFFDNVQKRFPTINRWMIGRGAVSNPFLLETLRNGAPRYDKKQLRLFHDEIFIESSRVLNGPAHLLGKMKELWSYLAFAFPADPKLLKKILKVMTVKHYAELIDDLFS